MQMVLHYRQMNENKPFLYLGLHETDYAHIWNITPPCLQYTVHCTNSWHGHKVNGTISEGAFFNVVLKWQSYYRSKISSDSIYMIPV